jgi:D-alanyl-D-alanine carboxypeptidase/D-alanyl-D-alanine-endopeptidase (penicillin-binding protein 4)
MTPSSRLPFLAPRRLARLLALVLLAGAASVPPEVGEAQRRSARRAPARAAAPPAPSATEPRTAAALAADLGAMLGRSTRSGTWGAMAVSVTRGDTLFAHNATASLQPASTMKLLTAVLALDRFGPEHRFRTEVLRDAEVRDGVLQGDLYLRGGGDPAFSGRFLSGGPNMPVDVLAGLVAGAGISRVTGSVVGDAGNFEERLVPAGWKTTYLHLGYAAPVSALSINENLAWISIAPGRVGGPATVTFEPSTSGVPIVNSVKTRGGGGSGVSVVRRPAGGFEVRGWIGARAPTRRVQMVIPEPAPYATGALRDALARAGVQVDGGVRLGTTPTEAVLVAALPSPPLSQLLAVMNRESVNHYAELIFRNAARAGGAVGSAETGDAALRDLFVSKLDESSNSVVAADGSGLSLLDRVTPRAMTRMLAWAHEQPWGDVFHASLPVAGQSELLRTRMRGGAADGNLHAKTGTTDEVIGLAGYTTALNGEVVAFTFIYNGTDRWNARAAIDAMGTTLSAFARP